MYIYFYMKIFLLDSTLKHKPTSMYIDAQYIDQFEVVEEFRYIQFAVFFSRVITITVRFCFPN